MDRTFDLAHPTLEWRSLAKGAAVVAFVGAAYLFGPSAVALTRGLDVLTALLMAVLVLNVGAGFVLLVAALASHVHDLYHTHDQPPPSERRPLLVRAHHPHLRS